MSTSVVEPATKTPIEELDIVERVAAGAALLDEHRPGWGDEISLRVLNLGSDTRCVLGQSFGFFEDGQKALRLSREDAARHGFMASGQVEGFRVDTSTRLEYVCLTEAWTNFLQPSPSEELVVS